MKSLYNNRKLSEGYPDLIRLKADRYNTRKDPPSRIPMVFRCLDRLIDLQMNPRTVLVIGCGPIPKSLVELREMGFKAIGIEPVPEFVDSAKMILGEDDSVRMGSAEAIPLESSSQRVVLMESVLEHVDSITKSLYEVYRVLIPGGVAYVYTTNQYRFSITGSNEEFRPRFYNWFPEIVKESYVHKQLHYDPALADCSPRPAVHWFSYSRLCRLGRDAGFSRFYSFLDMLNYDDPWFSGKPLRRLVLKFCKYNPWLRALALTQVGNSIFMWKRAN